MGPFGDVEALTAVFGAAGVLAGADEAIDVRSTASG
jgi:hypothetical protein